MERRTTLAIMMILTLGMAARAEDGTQQAAEQKAAPKWSEQSKSVQRLFEQQAPNWVKIGDKLWCVEVMKEAEKRAKRGNGDAYSDTSAPWFYEPVGATRCRWIGEVYKVMKLDAPEGYEVLEGRASKEKDGRFYFLPKKQSKNIIIFNGHVTPIIATQTVLFINKEPVDFEITNAGGNTFNVGAYKQAEIKDITHDVAPNELFDYFNAHQIKEFPVWRAKPNREHDGFEWNNYPRQIK